MADVNNKLRLQIVTQLDAAGIKATKDQVDQLELCVRRAGNAGSEAGGNFGKLEKALGNLPGPIGKIGGALGGIAGQATMIVGVFTTGFKIGEQLREWAVGAYEWASGLKEAREMAAFAVQQNKELAAAAEEATQRQIQLAAKQAAKSAEAVRQIDEQTSAYFRQCASIEGLKKAEGNAELMQLERDKFEDVTNYAANGNPEAAEQIGRYYDVLKEELLAKQQLEAFDRESLKYAKDRASEEEKAARVIERTNQAKDRLDKAQAKLDSIDRHENGARGGMYAKLRAPALKELEDAQKQYNIAVRAEEKVAGRIDELDAIDLQRKMERANLQAGGSLAIDRAAAAYDSYVAQTGNPLNAEIDQAWSQELAQSALESNQIQRDVLSEVRKFGEKLESLLMIK